ncbi:PhoU domain-containing protein [Halosolutus gelatinilyticus]|uniref:PhoU domain-containing protein n=1 Tax=Halosolutus gelatinilyticus TaxID=2931975 RepID=UPI001FF2E845|nr:PhoU domain-containing protein [Halosolutus gelatinilyticus]
MTQRALSNGALDPVERKVQLAGNSTFVVSLPKDWAIEQGLESGMSMYLYPHEDRLVAATETVSTRERTATVDAGTVPAETAVRRVRSAYAIGCDRITVTGLDDADSRLRRRLERTVTRLIGTAIQEDTGDRLVIANLLDSSEVSLPQTVAQTQQLALELYDDAIDAVLTDDPDLARRVIDRDDDVDRLVAFVSRGFHRGLENVHEIERLGTDRLSAFRHYRIARQLERIADHAAGIATVATRQSRPPGRALADRLEAVATDARTVVDRSVSGDPDRACETMNDLREAIARLDRELADGTDANAYLYGALLRRIRRTAEHGIAVADATSESWIEN